MEGDCTTRSLMLMMPMHFYPRPPGGGRPSASGPVCLFAGISIHALRVEGDRLTRLQAAQQTLFLSTPSGWRATSSASVSPSPSKFLSTPSGWRATFIRRPTGICFDISIHALRVEGDNAVPDAFQQRKISIHALRVEGDLPQSPRSSTRSDFYPRPPGGGRL